MTTMRCPICSEFLQGDGEAEMTSALREHMITVHELQETPLTGNEGREHRPDQWEGMKQGTVPVEREPGEDVEETILCPYCAARVYGHDGDDLSNHLRVHLEEVHDVWPSALARRIWT